jgi:hypothetical protein
MSQYSELNWNTNFNILQGDCNTIIHNNDNYYIVSYKLDTVSEIKRNIIHGQYTYVQFLLPRDEYHEITCSFTANDSIIYGIVINRNISSSTITATKIHYDIDDDELSFGMQHPINIHFHKNKPLVHLCYYDRHVWLVGPTLKYISYKYRIDYKVCETLYHKDDDCIIQQPFMSWSYEGLIYNLFGDRLVFHNIFENKTRRVRLSIEIPSCKGFGITNFNIYCQCYDKLYIIDYNGLVIIKQVHDSCLLEKLNYDPVMVFYQPDDHEEDDIILGYKIRSNYINTRLVKYDHIDLYTREEKDEEPDFHYLELRGTDMSMFLALDKQDRSLKYKPDQVISVDHPMSIIKQWFRLTHYDFPCSSLNDHDLPQVYELCCEMNDHTNDKLFKWISNRQDFQLDLDIVQQLVNNRHFKNNVIKFLDESVKNGKWSSYEWLMTMISYKYNGM